jgi:hypothetical protein
MGGSWAMFLSYFLDMASKLQITFGIADVDEP